LTLRSFIKRLFVVGAFLVLFSGQGRALTLSEIRTQIRLHTKDTSATRQRFTDAQLNTLINEAQRDVVNNTWALKSYTTFELVSGTTYYALPSDLTDITRVTWKNKALPEKSKAGLDADVAGWELTGGVPSSYFQDQTQLGYIGIYPFPNSATSTGTVKVEYVQRSPDLALDSDVPFNSVTRLKSYHDLLILYPCFKIFLIEGEQVKFTTYSQLYDSRLTLMRNTFGTNPNFNPGFSGTHK
jgi:hypothetical protein